LTLVKLDQPRQALEAFKRVVEIAPASDDARVARQWIRRLEDRLAGGRKPLEVGVQAPPFTLKDRTGILYRLDQYRGRRVVLLFVWSLDPQMRETVKDLDLRAGRTEGRYAAIVVALDVDRTAVRGFVTTENLSTPVLFGTSRVAELYGVTRGTALLYVISERGLVAQRQMGAIRPASVLP
jgi:peroxiredoxin